MGDEVPTVATGMHEGQEGYGGAGTDGDTARGMNAGANADAISERNGAEHSGDARQRGTIET